MSRTSPLAPSLIYALLFVSLLGLATARIADEPVDAASSGRSLRYLGLGELELPAGGCCLSAGGDWAALGLPEELVLIEVSRPAPSAIRARIPLRGGVAATAIAGGRLYVSHAAGGLSVYRLDGVGAPERIGQEPSIRAAAGMAATGGALLLTQGPYLTLVDVRDGARPRQRDMIGMPSVAGQVAAGGSVAVVEAREQGMAVAEWSLDTGLTVRSVVTVSGTAVGVDLVGDTAILAEREHRPFPVGSTVDRDERPMPPVPMWNRVHLVDLSDPSDPRREAVFEYDEGLHEGIAQIAADAEWIHLFGPTYYPGANVSLLVSVDRRTDPLALAAAARYRGGGGWPPEQASPAGLVAAAGRLHGLEQVWRDGQLASRLFVVLPTTDLAARLWLPLTLQRH